MLAGECQIAVTQWVTSLYRVWLWRNAVKPDRDHRSSMGFNHLARTARYVSRCSLFAGGRRNERYRSVLWLEFHFGSTGEIRLPK